MAIHTDAYDYRALWDRQRKRTMKLIRIGEAQRQELDEVRRQRDMLAQRLAELAHDRYGIPYPKTRQAA